jgi:Ser/Thr protein kinase RdoA (MazF antagonist)
MSETNLFPYISPFLGPVEFQTEVIQDGHIHDGWYIHANNDRYPETILQKVNTHVFTDPEGLMQNIYQITSYLQKNNPSQKQLNLIPTASGKIYYRALDGSIWRMYERIPHCYSTQITQNLSQVYEAGRVIGYFLKQLQDYPVHSLNISIPDFHNTPKRYQDFLQTLSTADAELVQAVQPEIEILHERSDQFGLFWEALHKQRLPWRVTHNDTKLDNILFDMDTDQAICLIDLDTIMPGSALFDFGDALRAMGNPSAEDEADLGNVEFQMPVFETFTQGYLSATGDILTEQEISWLALSPELITIEIGMRFLTDYLQGNQYFRIHYPQQNLNRCRTQFKLASDMEAQQSLMESIVQEISKSIV